MGGDTPIHLYRFLPAHRLDHLPAQSMEKMDEVYRLALEMGIRYPYIAGVIGDRRQSTRCPECGTLLISRSSEEASEKVIVEGDEISRFCPTYSRIEINLSDGKCPRCGFELHLVY